MALFTNDRKASSSFSLCNKYLFRASTLEGVYCGTVEMEVFFLLVRKSNTTNRSLLKIQFEIIMNRDLLLLFNDLHKSGKLRLRRCGT